MSGIVLSVQLYRTVLGRHGRVYHRDGDVIGVADWDPGRLDNGGHLEGEEGRDSSCWGDGVDGDVGA